MAYDITYEIRRRFVEDLALLVLEGWEKDSEYRRGWLAGYVVAWRAMTGGTPWQLVDEVNRVLDGSGKSITE